MLHAGSPREESTSNEKEKEMNMRDPKYFSRLGEKTCECTCHKDATSVMHLFPCCEFTYEKYISEEGVVDKGRLHELYHPEASK